MTITYDIKIFENYEGEFTERLRIYKDGRRISDTDLDGEVILEIRGSFDYEETGETEDSIPIVDDNALYLSVKDIHDLFIIMQWLKSDGLVEPIHLRQKEKTLGEE
jgi:hypothetical protein